jgi:hypothetical protein
MNFLEGLLDLTEIGFDPVEADLHLFESEAILVDNVIRRLADKLLVGQ